MLFSWKPSSNSESVLPTTHNHHQQQEESSRKCVAPWQRAPKTAFFLTQHKSWLLDYSSCIEEGTSEWNNEKSWSWKVRYRTRSANVDELQSKSRSGENHQFIAVKSFEKICQNRTQKNWSILTRRSAIPEQWRSGARHHDTTNNDRAKSVPSWKVKRYVDTPVGRNGSEFLLSQFMLLLLLDGLNLAVE